MTYAELVDPLLARRDMTPEHAAEMMQYLMSGEATDSQIGGMLLGLRIKGCTTRELAAFVQVMRDKAATIKHEFHDLVDTCGTGGGRTTFNLSTSAALVASAAGVRIAKHGNRSMTGLGSADVLEALGVQLSSEPERLLKDLEQFGIVFLFAPAHHPAMRHVARARKELGVRTVFNQLGPLANPAGAQRQLIGVYDVALMRSMGEALRALGTERAMLVHGLDGLDEISPCSKTEVVTVWDGRVSTSIIEPKDFGIEPVDPDVLNPAGDIHACAKQLRTAISDPESPLSTAIIPNAAATIFIGGLEPNLADAAYRAKAVIREGLAIQKLEQLISASGEL